jgi:hypothetical protein
MIPLRLKDLVWPPWGWEARRSTGWWKLIDAVEYLVMKESCDKNDIAAARILNNLVKGLIR